MSKRGGSTVAPPPLYAYDHRWGRLPEYVALSWTLRMDGRRMGSQKNNRWIPNNWQMLDGRRLAEGKIWGFILLISLCIIHYSCHAHVETVWINEWIQRAYFFGICIQENCATTKKYKYPLILFSFDIILWSVSYPFAILLGFRLCFCVAKAYNCRKIMSCFLICKNDWKI